MSRVLASRATRVYQTIINEVKLQSKSNTAWEEHFATKFKSLNTFKTEDLEKDIPKELNDIFNDAYDLSTYLENSRKHKELLELYKPAVGEEERVQASAKRVGLQLPKMFGEMENITKKD